MTTVELRIPNEAGLQKSVSTDAALEAVLVVRNVHDSKQVAVVDRPAAGAAYWP